MKTAAFHTLYFFDIKFPALITFFVGQEFLLNLEQNAFKVSSLSA